MRLIADLHLHSRFSRAVSPRMNIPNMYIWGRKKGINLLTVADYTHPIWFKEIKAELTEISEGIYTIKSKEKIEATQFSSFPSMWGPNFMLTTEIANIYSENGKVHKIHNLVFSPNLEIAEKINKTLAGHGFNLNADGRPILGISAKNLYELLLSIDERIIILPCHVWTPWFSLYGSRSGYDSINDCFGEYAKYIYAVETGLSSDPSMNWRIKELNNRSIVSSSDSHSLEKMGREATIFAVRKDGMTPTVAGQINYDDIISAFRRDPEGKLYISGTIEFYPEEGKYHYTGHRLCKISYSPLEVKKNGEICPVCKRSLTIGVMDRVEKLAGSDIDNYKFEKDANGVVWVKDKNGKRPPYVSLVPLLEVIAEANSKTVSSDFVVSIYEKLVSHFGSDFLVLLKADILEIEKIGGREVAIGIKKTRTRDLYIEPGFDGEYGKVEIDVGEKEDIEETKIEDEKQMGFGF